MTLRETEIIAVDTGAGAQPSISWAAVIAGAVAAAATSLVLMLLGAGLGLAVVSPFSATGATVATLAISGLVWLVIVQWLSSGIGGYLAGRLSAQWLGVSPDEANFRDSAHGFMAWAVATILAAGLFTSAITTIVGGAASTVGTVASGVAEGATIAGGAAVAGGANPMAYFTDMMFRAAPQGEVAADGAAPAPDTTTTAAPDAGAPALTPVTPAAPAMAPATMATDADLNTDQVDSAGVRGEATTILLNSIATGEVGDEDRAYLRQIVSAETGLSDADAEARVSDVIARMDAAKTEAQEAADAARKAGATTSILMALALVLGAFIASVAAILGGNIRDEPRSAVRR